MPSPRFPLRPLDNDGPLEISDILPRNTGRTVGSISGSIPLRSSRHAPDPAVDIPASGSGTTLGHTVRMTIDTSALEERLRGLRDTLEGGWLDITSQLITEDQPSPSPVRYLQGEMNTTALQLLLHRCPPLSLMHGVMVAGGALRCLTTGEPVNDVDIFCASLDDTSRVIGTLFDVGYGVVADTDNAVTLTPILSDGGYTDAVPVQVIKRLVGTPHHILDHFDFTICQCLVLLAQRNHATERMGGELFMSPRFEIDCQWHRLLYTGRSITPPVNSLLRAFKYERLGYRLTASSLERLIAAVQGRDEGIMDEDTVSCAVLDTTGGHTPPVTALHPLLRHQITSSAVSLAYAEWEDGA